MHWGCFDLTDEPVDLAPRALAAALAGAEGDPGRVRLLAVGERWELGADSGRLAGWFEQALREPVV
jgi:hypothetical protein